ncbi:MAG: hypothetical protein LBF94_00845, partial [Puniceicoccales bacterium]|jgi:hypothetical protein|nr:hypothetical protein [Puniceicoccales bacterium]
MDVNIKKIGVSETLIGKENTAIGDEEGKSKQVVAAEGLPMVKGMPGDANQFSMKKSSCPERALSERSASAADETGNKSKYATKPENVNAVTTSIPVENEELRDYIELAQDIIDHPERRKGFKFRGKRLGKKDAKAALKEALKKFKNIDSPSPDFRHLENINYAYEFISKKLNKARATKAIKIGSALLSTGAAIAGTVLSCGTMAPLTIPTAVASIASLAETVTDTGKSIIAVLEGEDQRAAANVKENEPEEERAPIAA